MYVIFHEKIEPKNYAFSFVLSSYSLDIFIDVLLLEPKCLYSRWAFKRFNPCIPNQDFNKNQFELASMIFMVHITRDQI